MSTWNKLVNVTVFVSSCADLVVEDQTEMEDSRNTLAIPIFEHNDNH